MFRTARTDTLQLRCQRLLAVDDRTRVTIVVALPAPVHRARLVVRAWARVRSLQRNVHPCGHGRGR